MKGTQTEYNTLRKVVLGRIDSDNTFPTNDIGMLAVIASDLSLYTDTNIDLQNAVKFIPEISQTIIETTQRELTTLKQILIDNNVEVVHPTAVPSKQTISTPTFDTTQFPVYCPRDILLNFRDLIIVAPNLYQSRIHESAYYQDILMEESKNGRLVVEAPRPYTSLNNFNTSKEAEYITNTDIPIFEAANVLIDGERNALYYQISHSGNWAGFYWLESMIKTIYPEVEVYPLEVYNGTHLDTTISILNYDTVALNPERITNTDLLPPPLQSRNHIFPDIIDATQNNGLSSKWIGMNSLSINPSTIVVDSDQTSYIKQLETNGFTVLPHKLTYCDVLEGGHHCTTSDLRRDENY